MTAQQPYDVLRTIGDVELRHYPVSVLAQVQVRGAAEKAGNQAFRSLVRYIGGKNQRQESLAMTAPVLQEDAAEAGLTEVGAPGSDSWSVSFVLPGDGKLADYPVPNDSAVQLVEIPAHDAAAIRWSGRWSHATVLSKTEELEAALHRLGWRVTGPPRWARYDPPWKPTFLRRNEVILPVDTE
ncbi:MAG: heme-binding protein [Actinomycetia bacterium]|nr:heme-binding protein [Actinomycetes bacterium]